MGINKQNSRQYITEGLKGWKRYLPLINIALFFGVITIIVMGVVLFCALPLPLTELERLKTKITQQQDSVPIIQTDTAPQEKYDLLASENPFAPSRKEWETFQPMAGQGAQEQVVVKVPPKGITLHGVAIVEDAKKALIRNPDPAKHGPIPFLFVEEGNDIGGYKVKSIEPNLMRLVWEGQEFVVNIFADKDHVRNLPSPAAGVPYMPPQPPQQPPQRPEVHKRFPREMEGPRGEEGREEDWDEDWDEDWEEEDEEEEWDEEEEEEYWEEDYEGKDTRSRSPQPKRPSQRPQRR